MAATTDMAPNRTAAATRAAATRSHNGPRRTSRSAASKAAAAAVAARGKEEELASQIQQLQTDIKAITSTLAGLAGDKMDEAQGAARREARNLAKSGQQAMDDMQDEFGQLEKQIKDTIREKPLTAVAGAIALGFVLAVVTR